MTKALWPIVALLWILAVLDALEPGQGRFKFVPNLPALVEIKTDGSDPNDRTETPLPPTFRRLTKRIFGVAEVSSGQAMGTCLEDRKPGSFGVGSGHRR